jgi:hypothetical protein
VEFLRQILEIERDLVRRQVARRVGELFGKSASRRKSATSYGCPSAARIGPRIRTGASAIGMSACRSTEHTRACAYCT